MNAEFSCQNNCYTIELGEEAMKSVASIIVPEIEDQAIPLESGTLRIEMSDGCISQIAFSCTGSMDGDYDRRNQHFRFRPDSFPGTECGF